MALNIPFAGADLLDLSSIGNSLGLTILSNSQNAPAPGTLSLGNNILGLDATFETGPQSQPPPTGTTGIDLNVLEDIGHGRIESFDLHVLGNTVGAVFQPGDSDYQSNNFIGTLLDGDVANGFDGNNIENLHVNTVIDGLNIVATWDNSGDTNNSPIPVDILSPLIHGDILAGLGGGELHDVTIGDFSLLNPLG